MIMNKFNWMQVVVTTVDNLQPRELACPHDFMIKPWKIVMFLVSEYTKTFFRKVFRQTYWGFDIKPRLIVRRIDGEKPLRTAAHDGGHLLNESRQLCDMLQDLHG